MVGDDDVDPRRRLAGELGITRRSERAPLRAEAFRRAHRDLAPGPVFDAGHELVAVPGGGVRRPLAEAPHLPAHGRDVGRIEQRLAGLVGRAGPQPVQAQIVAAALEDREGRLAAEQRSQRRGQARQIAVGQLALQGDRGRRHDHGRAVADGMRRRRDQIGERLAGPGSRLHGEMLPGPDRPPDRLRHRVLAGPGGAPDAVHRRGQQAGHGRRPLIRGRGIGGRGIGGRGIRGRCIPREPAGVAGGHVWNATAPPGRPGGTARRQRTATGAFQASANTGIDSSRIFGTQKPGQKDMIMA